MLLASVPASRGALRLELNVVDAHSTMPFRLPVIVKTNLNSHDEENQQSGVYRYFSHTDGTSRTPYASLVGSR